MPYAIRRQGSKYEVVNTETDKGHGLTTKAKAQKQLRLLESVERGWQPTGEHGTFTRKVNGKRVRLHVKGG